MTKAQLTADLEGERSINRDLCAEVARLNRKAEVHKTDAKLWKAAYDGRMEAERETGVTVYVARASIGQPTCIYALGTTPDDDLSVALYLDSGRNIVGVVITDGQGDEVAGAGLVPFDRLAE